MRGRRGAIAAAVAGAALVATLAAVLLTRGDGGRGEAADGGAVPAVVGLPEETAQTQLVANGFSTQIVRRQDAAVEGTVIAQRPDAGERAAPGAVVVLTVSAGPTAAQPEPPAEGEVTVPRVVGAHHILAGAEIDATGLIADSVAVRSGATCGRVLRQHPAPGTRLRRGEHVRLEVSLGPEPLPRTQVPGLSGRAAEARVAAREFGFTVRTVEQDGGRPGFVIRQVPPALKQARELTQITLYVGR